MGDGEILDAIAAGDPAGLTIAYDHHAAEIYGFCRVMLGDPGDAADALQDTFAAADSGLRALRDGGHLRPWLFAMARGECHRRLSDRPAPGGTGDAPGGDGAAGDAPGAIHAAGDAPAGTDTADDAPGGTGAARDAPGRTDAAGDAPARAGDAGGAGPLALVRAALPALTGEEREVAELTLRYELASGGLARVLGVSGRRARAAAAQAQDAFGRALRAALVARTGRGSCPELAGMLADWDGALTAPLRDQILAHAAGCEACGPRSRRELAAGVLLTMLPVLTAPAGLRDQVLRAIAGESPAAVAYRARVARRAGPYDRSGFPRQPGPPPPAARRLKAPAPVRATAAVVAALAVVGGGTLLATGLAGQPGPGGPRSAASGPAALIPPAVPATEPAARPSRPHATQPAGKHRPAGDGGQRSRLPAAAANREQVTTATSASGSGTGPVPGSGPGSGTGSGSQPSSWPAPKPKPSGPATPSPSPSSSPGTCLNLIVVGVCLKL